MKLPLSTPGLVEMVKKTKQDGMLLLDGSFRYTVLFGSVSMRPILRRGEELFTATCTRFVNTYKVMTNGNYYGLTFGAKVDAAMGHDPVDPAGTLIEGQVVLGEAIVAGGSQPDMFYFAQMVGNAPGAKSGPGWHFVAGKGDPPLKGTICALGGVGPLIVHDLPYGLTNSYAKGFAGPGKGNPGIMLAGALTRRSNATLASVEAKPATTGKTILAYSARHGALLVGVQPHGYSPGQSYVDVADALVLNHFSDAVFLDGSDSSFFVLDGTLEAEPGENKDETMTVGLGFTQIPATLLRN